MDTVSLTPCTVETVLGTDGSLCVSPDLSLLASLHYSYSLEDDLVPSEVSVRVTRLADNRTWTLAPPPSSSQLVIISSVSWASNSQLAVSWQDSSQRSAVYSVCSLSASPPQGWTCRAMGTDGGQYGNHQAAGLP